MTFFPILTSDENFAGNRFSGENFAKNWFSDEIFAPNQFCKNYLLPFARLWSFEKKRFLEQILDLYRIEFILGDANWFLRQILVLYRISATRFCFVSSDISYHLHKYFICILEKKIYIYIYVHTHFYQYTFWLYIDICNGNIYYVCFLLADAPRFHVEKYLFINI